MKRGATLLAIGLVLLALVLLVSWPTSVLEKAENFITVSGRSASSHLTTTIDPPFGFHWGDSMAHVEALLGYSSAEIVARIATSDRETWIVEGLIQPGLKNALFLFEKNSLSEVELQCQYDAWSSERYALRLEDLRSFFDTKYHEGQPSKPMVANGQTAPGETRVGYGWRFQNTSVTVACRSFAAQSAGGLSVNDFVIHYGGHGAKFDQDAMGDDPNRWSDQIGFPFLSNKLKADPDDIPAESVLGITGARLLNVSDDAQIAFSLQIAVKLRQNAAIEPTKAIVQVNFYDAVAGKELIQTDATVNYDWPTHRDWKESNPELLNVSYARKLDSRHTPRGLPKLFGYVASVYYDGRLQSVQADPAKLINLFPIRTFISPFEEAQNAAGRGDYALAAQLYRRAADQGNLFALENLAWFYAQGKGVGKDYHQAAICYERASLQNTPRALNALAWFLATCTDDSIRDGPEAVRQATQACEFTYWQEWKYIDTLAAAWAETGDFKRAIGSEQQALALPGIDESTRKKMENRLALYRVEQPFRE